MPSYRGDQRIEALATPSKLRLRQRGSLTMPVQSHRHATRVTGRPPAEVTWSGRALSTDPHNIYWSRNSQLLVGISYTNGSLKMTASLGGDVPTPQSTGGVSVTFPTGYNFDKLKLRGANGEVNTFLWFGGEAKDSVLSTGDMADQFKTLHFLE